MNTLSDLVTQTKITRPNTPSQSPHTMRWQFVVGSTNLQTTDFNQAIFVHRTDGPESMLHGYHWNASTTDPEPLADPQKPPSPHLFFKSNTNHSTRSGSSQGSLPGIRLESQFQEIADRMSDDIYPMLSQASEILKSVVNRLQQSTYLSKADLNSLTGEVYRLGMLANWSDSASLHACPGRIGIPQVRRRFQPLDFKQAISPTTAHLCTTHSVQLEWQGWQQELPSLYVDPYHLSRAIVNVLASLCAVSYRGETIRIQAVAPRTQDQEFTIQILTSQRQLSWEATRLINASQEWTPTRVSDRGFLAAKRLIRAVGGRLSAVQDSKEGLVLRISVPSDCPCCLLKSWTAQLSAVCRAKANQVNLYAVRCGQESADRMNDFLHQRATKYDLVLRVTSNRWLIFQWNAGGNAANPTGETAGCKEAFAEPRILRCSQSEWKRFGLSGHKWLSHCVYRSVPFSPDNFQANFLQKASLSMIRKELSLTVEQLTRNLQPMVEPLDSTAVYSFQSPDFLGSFERTQQISKRLLPSAPGPDADRDPEFGSANDYATKVIQQWKSVQPLLASS